MKKLGLIALLVGILGLGTLLPQPADAVKVRGYYRNNGTYVAPYERSSPNALRYDNYNYSGGSLYNKSYYAPSRNYGSSWYTPAWNTQPDYWSGYYSKPRARSLTA